MGRWRKCAKRWNSWNGHFSFLIFTIAACVACPSGAGKNTIPPADVKAIDETEANPVGRWGVFLPLPEDAMRGEDDPKGTIWRYDIYRNSKQEVIIPYSFYRNNLRYLHIFNLSQNNLERECEIKNTPDNDCSVWKIVEGLEKIEEIDFMNVVTGDGFVAELVARGGKPPNYGYRIHSPEGKEEYKKIVWLSPEKHGFFYPPEYDGSGGKKIHYIRAESLFFSFYRLNSKTILGWAHDRPIVLVFKNDLTSPYLKNNETFVEVDGDLADSVYFKCEPGVYPSGASPLEIADECFVKFLKGRYEWLK